MSIINNAKEIANLVQALGNIELYRKIVELEGQIIEITQQLSIKAKIQYKERMYWLVDGDVQDGPYCQRCYDVERKLVRLQPLSNSRKTCYGCKITFQL